VAPWRFARAILSRNISSLWFAPAIRVVQLLGPAPARLAVLALWHATPFCCSRDLGRVISFLKCNILYFSLRAGKDLLIILEPLQWAIYDLWNIQLLNKYKL
jgi:hypothetical protein